MRKLHWVGILGLAGSLAIAPGARAQSRPYIGFTYPAGGQQGTTFQVKLGGQSLDDVEDVLVSGKGVEARVVEYLKKLGPQEITLLSEQLRELKRAVPKPALARGPAGPSKSPLGTPLKTSVAGTSKSPSAEMAPEMSPMMSSEMMMGGTPGQGGSQAAPTKDQAMLTLIARIEKRIAEYVQRPASESIANLAIIEIKIARDAQPGDRELRLVTPRGVSNPVVFQVGQVPELCRKSMITSAFQVLGKEELALRKRPPEEVEDKINVPCTVNGQVASGEVNRYRFLARKGQRLIITAHARQLIPYIADAVPGWFQPVLVLYDANGKELAYDDDYRFKPDPVIVYEVPKDGEFVFGIYDGIYRGREDFVYRVTIGELPFLTSIFPLGTRVGTPVIPEMKGWNLQAAKLATPPVNASPGIHRISAAKGSLLSNRVPFAVDTLPECIEKEDNNTTASAQKVQLPIIVNGRVNRPDDWDAFQFPGRAGETIVAEVFSRRLDSPLDSMLKITDAAGKLVAFNDDREDIAAGVNTHHADSYLMVKLPADGTYCLHIGDTARNGGEDYGYRLRICGPQPDFALRIVPSSIALRGKSTTAASVYAIRQDGFTNAIKLALKDPPPGFSSSPVSLIGTQEVVRITIKADVPQTKEPVNLFVEGRATVGGAEVVHQAVPAEDRMQAFLWKHLVPAEEFKALVYDPNYQPPPKRVPRSAQLARP